MKEMIINIPEESSTLVTELVEKLGGNVKPARKKSTVKKKKAKPVEHDFLFGKWKDFDIDARKLREELWRRD
jgi:hypothetical protein